MFLFILFIATDKIDELNKEHIQLNVEGLGLECVPDYNGRIYCHVYVYCQQGFGLGIGFIDYFNIQLVTKNDAVTELNTLQITRAHAKSSQSAFTSRFLVTDINNGDSSASVLTSLPAV
jgi:hypothetical protein